LIVGTNEGTNLSVRRASPVRRTRTSPAVESQEGGIEMLAAFAGIGLVFITVVALSIMSMIYLMLRHA
jgi:hypothetical protein